MQIALNNTVSFGAKNAKPRKTLNVKETFVACVASSATSLALTPVSSFALKQMGKQSDSLTTKQVGDVLSGMNKMLEQTGLAKKRRSC